MIDKRDNEILKTFFSINIKTFYYNNFTYRRFTYPKFEYGIHVIKSFNVPKEKSTSFTICISFTFFGTAY